MMRGFVDAFKRRQTRYVCETDQQRGQKQCGRNPVYHSHLFIVLRSLLMQLSEPHPGLDLPKSCSNATSVLSLSYVRRRSDAGAILIFVKANSSIRIKSQPWLSREILVSPNLRAQYRMGTSITLRLSFTAPKIRSKSPNGSNDPK